MANSKIIAKPRRAAKRRVPRPRPVEVPEAAARIAATGVRVEQHRRLGATRDPLMNALQVPYFPQTWSDDECGKVVTHLRADWHQIQAYFQGDREAMGRLVKYRKQYVDGLINELAAERLVPPGPDGALRYPGLIARASGSTDLTSDYDVTLATTEAGDADARAAAELGRRIKAKFGKQSATVFDTNFYLCDFLGAFKNNIVADKPDATAVARTSPASVAHQDVLALMKVRRYMRADEWHDYTRAIVNRSAVRHAVTAQIAAVDQLYRERLGQLVAAVSATLVPVVERRVLAGLDDDDARLHALDAFLPDKVRAVADALCEAANSRLRSLQAELAAWTPARRAAEEIRRDIEQATGDAAFLASEAYHTEGALLQIVVGRQDVLPQQYLDSLNEQLGDFVKDVRHYTGERDRDEPDETANERARRREHADGVMFFRGAKYMSRLLAAIIGLQAANPAIRPQLVMPDGTAVNLNKLREDVEDTLVPLRRNHDGLPIEQRAAMAQVAVRKLFPEVDSPERLKAVLLDWVAAVNAAARDVL